MTSTDLAFGARGSDDPGPPTTGHPSPARGVRGQRPAMTRPRRADTEIVWRPIDSLPEPNLDGPVMLADRTGVYVHSFKCRHCRLEFQLFSWLDDRHTSARVFCPECGLAGRKLHWIATVNEAPEFLGGSGREIFRLNPHPGSILLDD